MFSRIRSFLIAGASGATLFCLVACVHGEGTGAATPAPPGAIPITFTIAKPGEVTLVIDDASGKRVRNLISQTPFETGRHTVYWDGLNDGETILVPHTPGIYSPQTTLVTPGSYRVNGLVHDTLGLRYQFTAYPTGLRGVPWPTNLMAGTGGWLADHSAPTDALYLAPETTSTGKPQVLLVAGVAEAGLGLAWVDMEGNKLRGQRRLGGQWTGAEFLARDRGPKAIPGVQAYAGSGWSNDVNKAQGEIRLNLLTATSDQPVLNYPVQARKVAGSKAKPRSLAQIGGLAVYNGILVATLEDTGELLFASALSNPADARKLRSRRSPTATDFGRALGTVPLPGAGALAFDLSGRLLVIQGLTVHRYDVDTTGAKPALARGVELISTGLEAPERVAVGDDGTIYVSDRGNSQQIKLFSPEGKFLRAIGKAGPIVAGTYDPDHMNSPSGFAVTPEGQVWVAERNKSPKRISVWNPAGKLITAYYGPTKYGGGGTLDPRDPTRLYYAEAAGAMEFQLDWTKGESRLKSVYWRHDESGEDPLPSAWTGPQTPLYANNHQYMTNTWSANPVRGAKVATLYLWRDEKIQPSVFVGDPTSWSVLSQKDAIAALPAELDLDKSERERRAQGVFIWCDRNEDGHFQPGELSCLKLNRSQIVYTVSFERDLSVNVVLRDGTVLHATPNGTSPAGVPLFQASDFHEVAHGTPLVAASGSGGEAVQVGNRTVLTGGPIQGLLDGKPQWTYPNQWPSLSAGHSSPATPEYPGQMLATTRIICYPIHVGGEDLWAVNSDKGVVYLMTMDGLFVSTLGKYVPDFPQWAMPEAKREMSVTDVNFMGECFWPTLNQAPDGKVYLIVGKTHSSLVRVDGLDSLNRLPVQTLTLTAADLARAAAHHEAAQQAAPDAAPLRIPILTVAPRVDGDLGEWANLPWSNIDADNRFALAIAGDRLYAAFNTNRESLLENAGTDITALFHSGGALDLQLGPAANPERTKPAIGDVRLLVTQSAGKTVASLTRAVVPGTAKPVEYVSPGRTVTVDNVQDVSSQVQLAVKHGLQANGKGRPAPHGFFEFSIPLSLLGIEAKPGVQLRGDAGIIIGQGNETVARGYWHNKAAGLVNDLPSEAALTPNLWGEWQTAAAP